MSGQTEFTVVRRPLRWELAPAEALRLVRGDAHPVALFGYLAVLEGNPSSLKELSSIRTTHKLAPKGLRTLVKHARLDPHHRDEMFAQLDELPLTASQSELVALSAFHTIEHSALALGEILDSHRNQRKAS